MAASLENLYIDEAYDRLAQTGADFSGVAGTETPLYVGSDAALKQILARLAVEHWLNPCSVAAAADSGSPFDETFEFPTLGDMTQGELETAGWTFTNCSAVAEQGLMELTVDSNYCDATLAVSLSGDFDIIAAFTHPRDSSPSDNYEFGALAVVEDSVGDAYHATEVRVAGGGIAHDRYVGATWSTRSGGTSTSANIYSLPTVVRITRISGTIYFSSGYIINDVFYPTLDGTPGNTKGWRTGNTSDSTTFNKIALVPGLSGNAAVGGKWRCLFLRRYV